MNTRIVHCQKEKYDVYIGRKSPRHRLTQSIFANPYRIGVEDGTRQEVIQKYLAYAKSMIETNPLFRKAVLNLHGRTLGCWCCQTPVETFRPFDQMECHGEVLAVLAYDLYLDSLAERPLSPV
jgi:hypothetical protein